MDTKHNFVQAFSGGWSSSWSHLRIVIIIEVCNVARMKKSYHIENIGYVELSDRTVNDGKNREDIAICSITKW